MQGNYYMNRSHLLTIGILVGFTQGMVTADIVRFDELPFQSIHGLPYGGVTFDFRISDVASGDAFFASYGPGELMTVSDPSVTGPSTGILGMQFDVPTRVLEFGVALNTANTLEPGFVVELFDTLGQSIATIPVDTMAVSGMLSFSEARFIHQGTPISRATVDFADAPGSFAFDNLVYQVPEPPTLTPLVAVVLLGGIVRRPSSR